MGDFQFFFRPCRWGHTWIFPLLITFFLMPIELYAQETGISYFSEKRFPEHPLITLKENFLGNPVYFIEGEKVKASEVRAYMEIMPGDAKDFAQTHTKALTGTGISLGGQLVILGALGYAYDNRNRLNNQIVRNWFIITTGGSLVGGAGKIMNRQSVRKINSLLENHNYLIRQDELSGPYLKIDFRQNILGEKIDIYDGPNLLGKKDINRYREDYPEFVEYFQKAQRNQNWSFALDILNLASSLVFVAYIASPHLQSYTPSNFIVPLTVVNAGISISSGLVRRAARNQTRIALMKFNFGDEFVAY